MTSVSVVIPFDAAGDEHRIAAYEFVIRRLAEIHPGWQILAACNAPAGEWSKGAAVAELAAAASGDVLVVHDADSYTDPDNLADAVDAVAGRRGGSWCVPHRTVYRLTPAETTRTLSGYRARRGLVLRTPYPAVPGGGITVLTRAAYDRVNGIDPRFLGWGGEDVAFGLALSTLVGPAVTGSAPLVHLWHPHPAPDLRGPPASEDLVAAYRNANGLRRRMTQLCQREPVTDPPALDRPARFRLRPPHTRRNIRIGALTAAIDTSGYETLDPDIADALHAHPAVLCR